MVDKEHELEPLEKEILECLKEGRLRFSELRDKLNRTRPESKVTNDKLNDRLKSLASYRYIKKIEEGHQKVSYELALHDTAESDLDGMSGLKSKAASSQTMSPLLQRLDINSILEASHRHVKETVDSFSRENLFLQDLYVERTELGSAFQEFLSSPQVVFAVVGETGLGKTSFLCNIASKMKDDVVVFLQGSSLTDDALSKQIMDRLAPSYSIDDLLESAAAENRRAVIIFDALNDYGPGRPERQRNLISEFNYLLYNSRGAKLKIIVTSRPYSWRLVADKLPRDKCYTTKYGLQYQLARLEDKELEDAYALYKKKNGIKTNFDQISQNTKRNMRTPGLLRMVAETYHDSQIPPIAPSEKVFDLYYRKIILRQDDIGTYPEESGRTDAFVKALVNAMLEKRRGYLNREEIDKIVVGDVFREHGVVILNTLLDSGLVRSGVGPFAKGYKFSYDWVFENLLAERIIDESSQSSLSKLLSTYAKDARRFQYLYGALRSTLVRVSGPKDFVKYARESVNNSDTQRIVVEAILSLSDYYPEQAGAILTKLAQEDDLCKEIAARCLGEMDSPPTEVQLKLLLSASDKVFDAVVESVMLSWRKSSDPYPPVLNQLIRLVINKFDVRRPLEAALEVSLRSITQTFMDPTKLTALRVLWMECLDNLVQNPKNLKNKIKKAMIPAAMSRVDPFIEGLGFQADDSKLVLKSAGSQKIDKLLYLLKYLDEESLLDGDDYRAACELALDLKVSPIINLIVSSIISYNLAKHYIRHPEFVKDKLNSDNTDIRSATLANLWTLARGRPELGQIMITSDLENELARNPVLYRPQLFDIFLQAPRDQDGKAALIENLLNACIAEGKVEDFYHAVEELSKVGILDPRSACLALQPYVNSSDEEIRRRVISAVQRIRIKDPDILEKYFEDAPEDFKAEVRHMNNRLGMREFSIIEAYSFCGLYVPVFREYMALTVKSIIEADNPKELKKLFVDKTLEMLMDERLFNELLQAVSNKNRWFYWQPTLPR